VKLLVVIVNYKTPGLTVDALASIAPEMTLIGNCRCVVTDNLSGDDSIQVINHAIATNAWNDWCQLRPLPRNGGFAYGNNEGFRDILESADPPQYVLLLNPDTVVRVGAIRELVSFMDANPIAGIAGSRLEDPDATPQRSAFRFPGALSEFETAVRLGVISRILSRFIVAPPVSDDVVETGWVAGASMIIRKKVFDDAGLLDESYFMYFEEVDFCLRARRAGWRCMYVPASRVVHLVGQASGVTDKARATRRRPAYWFESRRRYFLKNHGLLNAAIADLAFAVGFALWRVRRRLQSKPDFDPQHMLSDFISHSVWRRGRA